MLKHLRMKRLIASVLCAVLLSAASCYNDPLAGSIGSCSAALSATVDFRPMSSGLTQTRTPGDTIGEIGSLHMLLYDYESGKLVQSRQVDNYVLRDVVRSNADADNGLSAETMTKQAAFDLFDIDFGRYRIYAVANIPDLLDSHAEEIRTVEGLRSLPLTWDSEDMAKNGQMIGCFTKHSSAQQEDEPLVIDEKNVRLHAWLRRAASKITVAYDGSALNEGVFIYLKSVRIKDIPSQCHLGKDNNVGTPGYALAYPENGSDMPDGEKIVYYEGDEPQEFGPDYAGPRITSGTPFFGSHEEADEALFFYENLQGTGKDKRQDADKDGELDAPGMPGDAAYAAKDEKPYGTYVEVEAYYVSINPLKQGSGPITYRFMLGQDVEKDYNAKRNCHYKLTLKFKNFANDADWHIEYEEPQPSVMTPEPYYISYLYNHSLTYPIKINTGGRKIEYIRAEITDNRWAPYNANREIYYHPIDLPNANLWNGFLSLHQTNQTYITGSKPFTAVSNKEFYESAPKRGEREYRDFSVGEHTTDGAESTDTYRVEKHPTEANTYYVFIPMYTRAKQLIKSTGYTGNNPYVAYQRKASVKITTKLEGLEPAFENEATIYQVRRIVNPKGIYRSANNNGSFHVVLKRLPRENAEYFETFQSEGPWKAYVIKDTNGDGITLSGYRGKSECIRDTIHGKTGTEIDFNVDFSSGKSGNRYAIIRVEYHNYTCQHLIFVRQGNEPDNLIDGGAAWYAENMKTRTRRTATPLEEGSLFKMGNWDDPIDALNNKNSKEVWINVVPTDFRLLPEDGFTIAGTDKKKTWSQITANLNPDNPELNSFDDPDSEMRVAGWEDYEALYNNADIEQGYGILYGDDATETADHINDAYGYDYSANTSGRGMRGCFVYNKKTGKNLFFPIGASGYGHRKNAEGGILRYSAGQTGYFSTSPLPANPSDGIYTYPNGVADAPLLHDIYMRPGAIYWYRTRGGAIPDGPYVGWDINYFTFDFYPIGNYSAGASQDACFVRCIRK